MGKGAYLFEAAAAMAAPLPDAGLHAQLSQEISDHKATPDMKTLLENGESFGRLAVLEAASLAKLRELRTFAQAELREDWRLRSLQDLRGDVFLGLLRLAHSEGLLTELMQAAGCVASPAEAPRCPSESSNVGRAG